MSAAGVIECLKITTEPQCARIAKFAFDYATKHGRKKVSWLRRLHIVERAEYSLEKCR